MTSGSAELQERRVQRVLRLVDLVGDLLRVVPVPLEEPADHLVELRPGADLVVGTELRGRLLVRVAGAARTRRREGRSGGRSRRRRRQHRAGEPLRELGLGDAARAGGIELAVPDVSEADEFLPAQSLIAVLVPLRHELRHDRRRTASSAAEPAAARAACPRGTRTGTCSPAGGRRRSRRRVLMVGVGGGVNPGEALAAANELEERLPPCRRRRRVVRVVEECAGRAGEEDRVVLLEILLGDVRGIVGDGRRPRARLLSELVNRAAGEGNRRMHEARRLAEHQHLARLLRLGRRRRRQRRYHRLDVLRLRRLILTTGATAAACRYRGRRHRRREPGGNLLLAERAGLGSCPIRRTTARTSCASRRGWSRRPCWRRRR